MSQHQPNFPMDEPGYGQGAPGPGGPDGYAWGPAAPGYGYPPPYQGDQPYPPAAPGSYPPPLPGGPLTGFSLGDITVHGDTIVTPSGNMPLKGAMWNAVDFSRTEEKMPTYAVVLAVVFAVLCLVGLLFLLIKERVTTGFIQVTVSSGGRHHATMIPARDAGTMPWVMAQLNHARSLSL
ncbi:hypothetical protein [Streptomyces sp. ODS05-4]|uniref:hypothetical protein n=1 Tax=Streptomyces sp. ODS05-4 TaxID=2944939 RepID=UPI00210C74A6|nr:hypothetical protein [Streptomyces sp. ODS05-4]